MALVLHLITDPQSRLLSQIQPIYEESFPEHERRDFSQLASMLRLPEMSLFVGTEEHNSVGFAVAWDLAEFCFIEQLAVNNHQRGQGYGSEVLTELLATLQKPALLEVEPPVDDISARRIGFYQRFGFHLYDDFEYKQPSYDGIKPSVPMLLMGQKADYSRTKLIHYTSLIRMMVYERFYPKRKG